ncbi:MAG: multiple sugar transport system substrate-binding protein [Acetobacteraceae bacterium]|jgi:multiple sugar transport system substrate-binding protein|nr:multiple sugar transport system substrate-binding protein [Acetobacteraceae bacterium]
MSAHSVTRRGILSAAAIMGLPSIRRSYADTPVSLISHRYPGLEYYAEKIKTALPGVPVDARLMQAPEAIQLSRIALSARSNQMDLVWANNIVLASFAKSGWLEPLDDLWAKHAQEFNLDDISPTLVKSCMYDGHIYGMPLTVNTTVYAYRADLYDQKGLTPATTWDGYIENAKALTNPPRRYGATIALKADMVANEMNAVMNTVGEGWFDKDWRPTFNGPRGVEAVETYRRLAKYVVPGYTAVHNDEHTVNMGQDIAAQGQQWATRCSSMDNPEKSRVVGKIKWTVMPSGGRQVGVSDIYCISRYSAKDKDTLFRIIATALREENQRGAAALAVPTRQAVVKDPALAEKYRWYPAVSQALAVAQPMPSLPEFSEAAEVIDKRIVQAIVGQMETKAALDAAATEVQAMLTERGYYK